MATHPDSSPLHAGSPSGPDPSGLGDRIGQAADRVGGKRRLAHLAGVRESQLYRYIRGDNVPSALAASALAEAAGIRVDWLIRGTGPVEEPPSAEVAEDRSPYGDMGDWIVAPGIGNADPKPPALAFRRQWLADHGLDPQRLAQLRVGDDAMVPTFRPGDIVLVDARANRLAGSGIYLLELGGEPLVRRVAPLPDGSVRLQCDNGAYSPTEIGGPEAGRLEVFGRIVWAGGDCP